VPFVVLMGLVAYWALTYGIQLLFTGLEAQLFWDSMQYLGGSLTPLVFVVFVLAYTGHRAVITPGRFVVAATIPTLAGVLVWVPEFRWLVRTDATLIEVNSFLLADISHGPLFLLTVIYGYLCIGVGIALLIDKTRQTPQIYRRHSLLITVGAIVPVFGSTISYIFELTPVDMTPVGLSVFGVTVIVALTQYRLLDVVPIARDRIINEVNDGIIVTDGNDRIVDINPAARRILGIDGAIGSALAAVDADHVDELAAMSTERKTELVVPGETDRYYQCQKTALSEPGHHDEATIYILHEVTERRAREEWFRSLTEYSSDIICVLDDDLRISYVSPSIEQVLGYEPAAVEGERLLSYVHEDDRAEFRERIRTDNEEPARLTYRARTVDGSWRTLQSRSRSRLSDPVVEGIIVNIRDITEIQARKQELQRKNERLDMYTSVVSHDLRNPLSVATGRTQLLAESLPEEPEYTEHVDALSRALGRMDEIVEGTLTLAPQGADSIEPEPIELGAWLRQSWGMVDTGDARLDVADDLVIHGDRDQLQHLSENLFRNAIEHGPAIVTVRAGHCGENGIYIEDDGPGIPPDERETLFGSNGEDGPHSFGLAIVKRIADAHGWGIHVTESDGGGARFEFTGVQVRAESNHGTRQ
jgi:PAS domain S-box-containing protein